MVQHGTRWNRGITRSNHGWHRSTSGWHDRCRFQQPTRWRWAHPIIGLDPVTLQGRGHRDIELVATVRRRPDQVFGAQALCRRSDHGRRRWGTAMVTSAHGRCDVARNTHLCPLLPPNEPFCSGTRSRRRHILAQIRASRANPCTGGCCLGRGSRRDGRSNTFHCGCRGHPGFEMQGGVKNIGAVTTTHPAIGYLELVRNDPEHRSASWTASGVTHALIIAASMALTISATQTRRFIGVAASAAPSKRRPL
jgi:hypothetical protein